MPLELVTIRCLRDNFAYLVHGNGETALIDAPEASPVLAALKERGWQLNTILLTHHHDDHIQAVPDLLADFPKAEVIGNAADSARLPPLTKAVRPGEVIEVCGEPAEIIDVPGHTIGHVAYYLPESGLAFTADSLMAIGCGRLFEGDAPTMWASLSRLNALPADTLICSGHDYCAGNGAFTLSVEGGNAALKDRLAKGPCTPAPLSLERATNPFLRVAELRGTLGMGDAPDAEVFARLRAMKDDF